MKQIIYPIMFILLVSFSFALYSGETYNVYSGSCDSLEVFVEIEPYQDEDEYTFNQGCSFIEVGHYKCLCDGSISLDIIPKFNSVGKYTVVTDIYKLVEGNTGGGGSGGSYYSGTIISSFEKDEKKLVVMREGQELKFNGNSITLIKIEDDFVIIKVNPEYAIKVGETVMLDTDKNNMDDVKVYLEKILMGRAYLHFEMIEEKEKEVIEEIEEEVEEEETEVIEEEEETDEKETKSWVLLLLFGLLIVIIIIVLIFVFFNKANKEK